MNKKGLFVVLEGDDGSGTTTQLQQTANLLRHNFGFSNILTTIEPYKYGEVKSTLRSRNLSPEEQLELFVGDRILHGKEILIPNLEKGVAVVSDRYFISTFVYQGVQGIPRDRIMDANYHSFIPVPDITFILNVSHRVATKRLSNRHALDKFERDDEIREKRLQMYQTFVEYAERFPSFFGKVVNINGNAIIEDVSDEIRVNLKKFLESK